MKKAFLFCMLIILSAGAYAAHGNKMFMKRPAATWTNYPAAIKDVDIEVTPLGVYALVDLTFTIGPASTTFPTDSQEAVIFFDLPEGSYVHDSWLWLNPTTIISAELMERRKASEVYTGIVRRRRDPSLLYNVLPQGYQLNIYPVAMGYWRKVKITYSTPVLWQGGRANVPLPTDLLNASQTSPSFSLKINTNGLFYNPAFAERAFGGWLTGQSANSFQLTVPAAGYTNNDLTLSYQHYQNVDSRLSTYATGVNEGVYELIIPPAPMPMPRYFNFVIDHQPAQEIYSLAELQRMVQNLLTTSLRAGDFFNIYYHSSGGAVNSLFGGWHAVDSAGIAGIGPAFGGVASPGDPGLTALLKYAMLFTATGPANAETIVLNGNYLPMTSASAKSFMAGLSITPGIFNRKVQVINYHYSTVPGQTNMLPNTNIFHDMLAGIAANTGGTYTSPNNFYYDAYTQSTIYDINMRDALRQAISASLSRTGIYQVQLPMSGFTYSEHSISTGRYYSPYNTYTESGRYYGTFHAPDSILINYSGSAGMSTGKTMLVTVSAGDSTFKKTWNYHNNKELAAYGSAYKQEIIDSSIRNRVLSDFTAFLALETGDTIKASVGQNTSTIFPVSAAGQVQAGTLIAYPNPFRNQLTIECTETIEEIRVYDISGSLVMAKITQGNIHQWIWDGTDNSGRPLPAGIYLIRVAGKGHSTAIRVNKLDK